jgi:hypothetical protein
MSKSKGITLPELSNGSSAGRAHRDVAWQPGAGHNSRGIESVIAPRNAAREGLADFPPNPGERIDSTVPTPTTKRVASNTTKGPERFHVGGPDTTGLNETRPTNPTMERPLDPAARTSVKDSPIPIHGKQLPHHDLMTKADAERYYEDHIGNEPSGTLNR